MKLGPFTCEFKASRLQNAYQLGDNLVDNPKCN